MDMLCELLVWLFFGWLGLAVVVGLSDHGPITDPVPPPPLSRREKWQYLFWAMFLLFCWLGGK